jgi:hypothetical protein
MKNIKNYIIAILAGLLALTLSTQPSQGAGTSKEAKIVQYTHCFSGYGGSEIALAISNCKKYQP